MPITVVQVREEDWESHRDLRLEMLLDAPEAFWSRHSDLVGRDESFWRSAAAQGLTLQARDGADRAVGTLTVALSVRPEGEDDPAAVPTALVLAVYVRPEARGRGASDALLRAAETVGREAFAAQRLVLHVSELNDPALALYARHGYIPTGRTIDHPRLEGVKELELAKPLHP